MPGYTAPAPAPAPATTTPTAASLGFSYPTPSEASSSILGQPYMAGQMNLLGNMLNRNAFHAAVLPEVQGVMRTLGRSGLPSSSYADRMITDTLGSAYYKWLWNALTGYQNIGAQMQGMLPQWYAPYNTMLSYVGS